MKFSEYLIEKEDSTKKALETLKAIIGALKKGDKDNDMLKMAMGMKEHYDKEGSFSPKQAEWIYKVSEKLFK